MVRMMEQIGELSAGEIDFAAIDCEPVLDSGETVSSVTSVTEITSAVDDTPASSPDLTLDTESVSTAELVILDRTIAIGKAVQFRVQGQVQGSTYFVKVIFTTSASRTKAAGAKFTCV